MSSRPAQTSDRLRELLDAAERQIAYLESSVRALQKGNASLENELREVHRRLNQYERGVVRGGAGGSISITAGSGGIEPGSTFAIRVTPPRPITPPGTRRGDGRGGRVVEQVADGFAEMEKRTAEVRHARDERNAPEPTRFTMLEID